MSQKKIMILCGSPRPKGNTHTLADWAADGAKSAGAEVERIDVTRLRYASHGCTSCYGCQKIKAYRCVLKDEASELLARIPEVNAVVIATPIYFFGPSAQTKVLLDRAYSLFKFDMKTGEIRTALKGISIGVIASAGGDAGQGLKAVEDTYRALSSFVGGAFFSLLVPEAPHEAGELSRDNALREKATAFGRALASSL
jgi:multimeric flavodoxin WrbA